ncbi:MULTISPECIES: tripartite tricarboxylate transporter substrate-binding protein [unclassified Bosea (in: a-proteobacteria)]|uniref:tripartite tricarboxylate transporter substrate-binding protein n=1 Tax=unclassified Bosea (in: a-proteobacteria) TaxID=2653178 RepID=UPI00095657D1|nr:MULTISPECIES: tripartite tricarboxylate transporter substrate-binding protein [unclassified Bosea (in: a-proteobacteria)]TAJ34579.1 MAG: tripartite tricarboxylate transporter substrate binding protein BugD [Bosea sp. (in: a-proteobacteria)]SIQ06237.1 Tripartite-type tricarboxylate transporter, receptor component TctC [Bosea sp. TND4EK4]
MKKLVLGLATAATLALVGGAQAQGYPTKPVTMIVPFAAGGPTDIIARIVADHMSKTLGQQIVIENVAGAGGTTGITRAITAAPDGYTIAMGHLGTFSAAPATYPGLKYDPINGMQTIGLAGGTPILIVARKTFEPKDLKTFVSYVKENKDKVNEAHAGVGSVSWTTCTLLKGVLGTPKINSVAYRGTGPALNDLVSGQVDFMCDQIVSVAEQVRAGSIKAYAVASATRSPALPDVPTTKEAGLPEFQIEAWNGIAGPKGMPKEAVDKLVDALNKALNDEATKKRLLDLGTVLPTAEERTPAGFAALIKRDADKLTPVLSAASK